MPWDPSHAAAVTRAVDSVAEVAREVLRHSGALPVGAVHRRVRTQRHHAPGTDGTGSGRHRVGRGAAPSEGVWDFRTTTCVAAESPSRAVRSGKRSENERTEAGVLCRRRMPSPMRSRCQQQACPCTHRADSIHRAPFTPRSTSPSARSAVRRRGGHLGRATAGRFEQEHPGVRLPAPAISPESALPADGARSAGGCMVMVEDRGTPRGTCNGNVDAHLRAARVRHEVVGVWPSLPSAFSAWRPRSRGAL